MAAKYKLNLALGSGGMAEVWSATNTFTDRQVAIKFLSRELDDNPEASARFLREAKISARIDHPNVIDILDVGKTDDGQLFLVMELLTGLSLEVALHRQSPALSLVDFTRVMVDVARALEAAHRCGVVHRDLKPANIFLHNVKEGVVIPKLLDFGVSKLLEESVEPAITIPGTVLGSPLYMSPEQARGDDAIDGRTDVFSFGAILFEALTGQRAYEAKNFHALIVKIATSPPKSIDTCGPDVPESLRKVVRACVDPDLSTRVATFAEVKSLLEAALPELRSRPARLPKPLFMAAAIDPDATNALPVMKSEPPPPPIATATSTSLAHTTPRAPARRPLPIAFAAAAFTIVGVLAAVGVARMRKPAPVVLRSVSAPPAPPALAEPAMPAGPRAPIVPVDSLPDAAASASSSATPPTVPARGRLEVLSPAVGCTVSIDGRERGATPYRVELAAGSHAVACVHEGQRRASHLTVHPGMTATLRVAFDDAESAP